YWRRIVPSLLDWTSIIVESVAGGRQFRSGLMTERSRWLKKTKSIAVLSIGGRAGAPGERTIAVLSIGGRAGAPGERTIAVLSIGGRAGAPGERTIAVLSIGGHRWGPG